MVNNRRVRFFEGFSFKNWFEAIGTLVLMVLVIAAVTIGTVWLLLHGSDGRYEYEDTVTYFVEQGDTLWTIARQYSDPELHDVRRVIDMIEELNSCNATIYPGDALEIPVFSCLCGQ